MDGPIALFVQHGQPTFHRVEQIIVFFFDDFINCKPLVCRNKKFNFLSHCAKCDKKLLFIAVRKKVTTFFRSAIKSKTFFPRKPMVCS